MKALQHYRVYIAWCKENSVIAISFERFCDVRRFFKKDVPEPPADDSFHKEAKARHDQQFKDFERFSGQ